MRNTRKHPHYPVRYGIFKPSDRSDTFYSGYIYDINTRQTKRWNTREAQQRDAWKRVQEMIESIYGSGSSVSEVLGEVRQETLADVLTRYLEEYYKPKLEASGKSADKIRKLYQSRKRVANRITEHLGTMTPGALNRDILDDYIKQRRLTAEDSTIKLETELLKTSLPRVLRERGVGIVAKIKGHIKLIIKDERKTTIGLPEFEAIVDELPEYMRLPIRLQHMTGARPSEIRTLKWSNVFVKDGCLRFKSHEVKEGKPREVELDKEMIVALAIHLDQVPKNEHGMPLSECVFHGLKAKVIPEDTYNNEWNEACQKLGYIDFSQKTKGGRPVSLFKKHDIRRTRISNLVASGKFDIKTISKQVGHSAAGITYRYTQPDKSAQKEMAQATNGIDIALHRQQEERIESLDIAKKEMVEFLERYAKGEVWMVELKNKIEKL